MDESESVNERAREREKERESAVPFISSPLNDIYSDTHFIFYLSH